MLIDWQYHKRHLVTSYIDDRGMLQLDRFKMNNRNFEVTHPYDKNAHPKYRTWDGKHVKYSESMWPNRFTVYDYLDSIDEPTQDKLFKYQNSKIFFCDIETEISENLYEDAKVLTIALTNNEQVLVLGIKPLKVEELVWVEQQFNNRFKEFGVTYKVKYIDFSKYENPEYDMLHYFFNRLVPHMPIITGWYFIDFDWVFLVGRARKIGVDPSVSSPTRTMKDYNKQSKFGKKTKIPQIIPAHRAIVDYLELHNKFNTIIKIKEADTLDFVAEKILGGQGKVSYTGSLMQLYENDYANYIFYNAVDTILVQLIHQKTKYINILYAVSALAKIPLSDSLSTLRVTEGILRKDFRDELNIVLCYNDNVNNSKLLGGYVQDPIRGLNKMVACYDFASLYPTTQRQNNIGPETYKGILNKTDNTVVFNNRVLPLLDTDIICKNNAVFDNTPSVTCKILERIYIERKKYKKMMIEQKELYIQYKKELEELEMQAI